MVLEKMWGKYKFLFIVICLSITFNTLVYSNSDEIKENENFLIDENYVEIEINDSEISDNFLIDENYVEIEVNNSEVKNYQGTNYQGTNRENKFTLNPILAKENLEINSQGAILIEPSTKTILYEKNIRDILYPASTTKALTSLVVLDYFSPEELITVGNEINQVPWDSSKAGHIAGEMITVENLIRGLMLPSGNDSGNVACVAVAKRISGDENLSFSQYEEIFTNIMNEKAKSLGAENSNFVNAHGYHDENHYSTVYDMAMIASAYISNDFLLSISGERIFSGDGASGIFADNSQITTQNYTWNNSNLLITNSEYNYEYATGIKTGFHTPAGYCLISSANKDGEVLIAVVLKSEDKFSRFTESKSLYEYGYNSYEYIEPFKALDVYEVLPLVDNNPLLGSELDILYEENINFYIPKDLSSNINFNITYSEKFTSLDQENFSVVAPVSKGDVIGKIEIVVDDVILGESNLIARNDVEKGELIHYIEYYYNNFLEFLFSTQGYIFMGILIFFIIYICIVTRNIRKRRKKIRSNEYIYKNSKNKMRKKPVKNKNKNKNRKK